MLHACALDSISFASYIATWHQGFDSVEPRPQVCDQPHPLLVAKIVQSCLACDLQPAYTGMKVPMHRHLLPLPAVILALTPEHRLPSSWAWAALSAAVALGTANMSSCCADPSCDPGCVLPSLQKLFDDGYSSTDIIGTVFRVVRNTDMIEFLKLEYIKVCRV